MIVTLSSWTCRRARWLLRISLPLLLVASMANPAAAQIFKCTAGSGQVTYQNEPCPKNFKADQVDIFDNRWTADRAEKDAQWQRQAAQHHVVAGMPLHWVREALGEPAEIRETATAGAKEVWLYNFPDRSVQVGILADQVLWSRETPVIASQTRAEAEPDRAAAGTSVAAPQEAPRAVPDASRPASNPSGTLVGATGTAPDAPRPTLDPSRAMVSATGAVPDAPRPPSEVTLSGPLSPRVSETAHGVARGQDCKQALAALGKPDRQRDVPAVDKSTDPVSEYFYEPAGSDNPTRIRIVCANGKVEGVDRSIVR
jgi:hypothetical protein